MSIVNVRSPALLRARRMFGRRYSYVTEIADDCINSAEQDSAIGVITSGGNVAALDVSDTYGVQRIGLVTANTAGATGAAGIGSRSNAFVLGQHAMEFETEIRTPTLSTSSQRYTILAGFTSDVSTISPSNGFLLRYSDNLSSGRWETWAQIGGSGEISTSTGIAVEGDTWYRLRLRIGLSASVMQAWINDIEVPVPADSAEYPEGGSQAYSFYCAIRKAVGTTVRSMVIDWVWCMVGSDTVVTAQ